MGDWTKGQYPKAGEPPKEGRRPCFGSRVSVPDGPLADAFDLVACINLPRRLDRWSMFQLNVVGCDPWPFKAPIKAAGIEGDDLPLPIGWKDGGGGYGCLRAHQRVLEEAILSGADSVLVFEDDAVFCEHFARKVEGFLKAVPSDWDALLLGGQHIDHTPLGKPTVEKPGIVRGKLVNRMHAYAIRGSYLRETYRLLVSSYGHCDHLWMQTHADWKVYCPDPFLVGQSESVSDICGKPLPQRFWHKADPIPRIVLLTGDITRAKADALEQRGYHAGFRKHQDGFDAGAAAFAEAKDPLKAARDWLWLLAWEAKNMDKVPLIAHPKAQDQAETLGSVVGPGLEPWDVDELLAAEGVTP